MKTITISVSEELYCDAHVAAALRDTNVTALLRYFLEYLSKDIERNYRTTLNRRVRAKRAQKAHELSAHSPQEKALEAKNHKRKNKYPTPL
ncbi:MAG TPA: hypothetical protein VMV98_04955, partial [Acidobacteriaceae bacterium]|nr:hypothetical protein [Acidobacteriaceae bacterium]